MPEKTLTPGGSFEFHGDTYYLEPWTQDLTFQFESWLERNAWDAVERTKPFCTEDVYERHLKAVAELVVTKRFRFGGQAAADAAKSLEGQKYSLYLMMANCKKNAEIGHDITEKLASAMWDEQLEATVKAQVDQATGGAVGPTPTPTPTPPA
jgi:hypothetical protein